MLFPIGRADDGAHSQNEKVDVNQFLNGIKLLGTYLEQFAVAAGGTTSVDMGAAGVGVGVDQLTCTEVTPTPATRPAWAKAKWGMCGNLAEGQCTCCF